MANQSSNPATTPPSTSTPSRIPYTPRSTSIPDDSDAEFDPTPLQSPGGPAYDDLPPSYDEARHQAVSDARNGVEPLDPNQIEAHRLTLNEGPDEAEVWEYRIRGEQLDAENEQAPEYSNITNEFGTTVPIQHVESSAEIPVGRTELRNVVPSVAPDRDADLLSRALNFTRHEPDADTQYAPLLARPTAIPQQEASGAPCEPVQFLRAYAKALHAHSIRPAEFMEFLDGLNALCIASSASLDDLLQYTTTDATSSIVHDYIRGANEAFFMPRGLTVSLRSLSSLVQDVAIPTERGQRAGALVSALDRSTAVERRAQALHPWIEAIETNVPTSSAQSVLLREMATRLRAQKDNEDSAHASPRSASGKKQQHEDPPHSIPEGDHAGNSYAGPGSHHWGGRGRGGPHGGPWTPFGAPGRGPFGAPGNGPFGAPGNGPFGARGIGPFARHCGPGQSSGLPRGSSGPPGYGFGPSRPGNDWNSFGESIGKWGEEFGKRMGDWGQQFGKQAENWGQDVGKRAEGWGQSAARASGSGSRHGHVAASPQAGDTLPPSYDAGFGGQETGVLPSDSKGASEPPKYDGPQHGKADSKAHEDDDDASSISSDSSDSDSDSDSDYDSDELPDTQAIFLKRIKSINKHAEDSARKGKKSPQEIALERDLAIEKAQNEKQNTEEKIEEKISKRAMRRVWKQKRKELLQEYRHKKRELMATYQAQGKGKGKGKSKAKKMPEWKQAKKEYRDAKKDLRKERLNARKEWRNGRSRRLQASRDAQRRKIGSEQEELADKMVWVVIENYAVNS